MPLSDAELITICNQMYPHRATVKAQARSQLRKLYEGLARVAAIEQSGVESVEMVEMDERWENMGDRFDAIDQ